MDRALLYFLLLCSSITTVTFQAETDGIIKSPSREKDLIRDLLNKYKEVGILGRPVRKNDAVVNISLSLELTQILDLEENKKTMKTAGWLNIEWIDRILTWNASEYHNVTEVRVFPLNLWIPDLKLYNFADERPDEKRDNRVVVKYNGEILWSPQSIFKSTCDVEFTYFPFDTQQCALEFISWTYDNSKLNFSWNKATHIILTTYVPNPEWIMDHEKYQNKTIPQNEFETILKPQLENGKIVNKKYTLSRFRMMVHRDPSLYIFVLILPSTLLSILTLVVFWLPPESSVKMLIGMNIFTAFFILLNLLARLIPQSGKKFPLIGRYFCMNMVMITLSTFIGTLVTNLYFRGSEAGYVPKILRRVIIENIGRRLWMRQHIPLPNEKKMPNILKSKEQKRLVDRENYDDCSTQFERNIRDVRQDLRDYVRRQKDKSCKNMIAMEWRALGSVLDRLFFFLYLIMMFLMLAGASLNEYFDYLREKYQRM